MHLQASSTTVAPLPHSFTHLSCLSEIEYPTGHSSMQRSFDGETYEFSLQMHLFPDYYLFNAGKHSSVHVTQSMSILLEYLLMHFWLALS